MSTALFLGGCRSGKSSLALRWVEEAAAVRVFVATARPGGSGSAGDPELLARIERHRRERGRGWIVLEPDPAQCPLDAVGALHRAGQLGGAALFDCVTLWLGDLLAAGLDDAAVLRSVASLADALPRFSIPVALVSNELGWGLVPDSALGRRFRDLAGEANQRLAAACDSVTLCVAGLPLALKGKL